MANEKRVCTNYAADIHVSNCGGSILWLETDKEMAKIQEETGYAGTGTKFGRVYTRKIDSDEHGEFVLFRRRKCHVEEFYDRNWGTLKVKLKNFAAFLSKRKQVSIL